MRGKVSNGLNENTSQRITPAYAGKSLHNACHVVLSQDHPRLCGEKFDRTLCAFCILGSPPPMRGKVKWA